MLAVVIDQAAEVAADASPRAEGDASAAAEVEALRAELAKLRALVVELAGPVVLADGRIAEIELRRQLCLEAARGGWRAGYRAGYAQSEQDMERHWQEIVKPILCGVTHAELNRRRYPPDGRLSWLLPRAADDIPRSRGAE